MAYVKRDSSGGIVAVSARADDACTEWVDAGDAELRAFVEDLAGDRSQLGATDQDFVRVLEDVVELLIDKGVILFTDLPDSAQEKMLYRQRLRSKMGNNLNLIGDD